MIAIDARSRRERLAWLDIARVLCALMILGIHWLRAAYNVHLFGTHAGITLVMDYQGRSGGVALLPDMLIAGTGASLATWLTNLVGVFGEFGWEAVSALILISGFSLAVSQHGKTLDGPGWIAWYGKRAKRILVPYYTVALPLLALCAVGVVVLSNLHGHTALILKTKLLSQFDTPLLGVITSHLFLFDPWGVQWAANFFAPAWWFVPAILLAYVLYPCIRTASRFGNGFPLLLVSAAVTVAAYVLADAGVLVNETWYYIVLQELFNFSLGVVIAQAWMGSGRTMLERAIADPRVFALAVAVFAIGNIANWTPAARPIASMLYGPSLVLIVAFVGKRLEQGALGRALVRCDSYDLYLVHQPLAFPIALFSRIAFHAYGVFVGWFVFVAVAVLAAGLLSAVQRVAIPLPRRTARKPIVRDVVAMR
jgi:peptidoglycan/LPS O-acetylase OafA/YrhL